MHFVWFSMWDGFFSARVSESRPSRVATRVRFGDEWWKIHLTWKTIQNAFSRILYTLRHFNQAKYTVQSCRSWKPCEMDLSHNCSLHGGMSEVCENVHFSSYIAWLMCISHHILWLMCISHHILWFPIIYCVVNVYFSSYIVWLMCISHHILWLMCISHHILCG